jgi:hypothetical protein
MGSSFPRYDRMRSASARQGWETRRENARRMALADKIVMAVVDKIAADIIRPGPVAEERECYVMAQELREHTAPLVKLVTHILRVAEVEDEP